MEAKTQKAAEVAALLTSSISVIELRRGVGHGERQGVEDRHAFVLAHVCLPARRKHLLKLRKLPREILRNGVLRRALLWRREACEDCGPRDGVNVEAMGTSESDHGREEFSHAIASPRTRRFGVFEDHGVRLGMAKELREAGDGPRIFVAGDRGTTTGNEPEGQLENDVAKTFGGRVESKKSGRSV